MADIHCKYCHHTWKHTKEYEKHLACCEYFYQFRRKPQTEMDDYGCKLPTQKELFRFVQELSLKCERLEREVARLKTTVSVRQKKVIVECLNYSSTVPLYAFGDWWKALTLHLPISLNAKEETELNSHWSIITNPFLYRVFNMGLVEGIKYVLGKFIESEKHQNRTLPIRCFTQKPNMFYIYCGDTDGGAVAENKGKPKAQTTWKIMSNVELEKMVDYISQLYVREFLLWQRNNTLEIENDERRGEEHITYMMQVNSMRPSKEKGICELRKWLFVTLEESAQTMAECEYE